MGIFFPSSYEIDGNTIFPAHVSGGIFPVTKNVSVFVYSDSRSPSKVRLIQYTFIKELYYMLFL